ncbi:hypothetical protein D3C87_1760110 [compost metagenome]
MTDSMSDLMLSTLFAIQGWAVVLAIITLQLLIYVRISHKCSNSSSRSDLEECLQAHHETID